MASSSDDNNTSKIYFGKVIETRSYHEGNERTYKKEIMQHFQTSQSTFLSDFITSLDVISSKKTRELTITIITDENYIPKRITRTHTVEIDSFFNNKV